MSAAHPTRGVAGADGSAPLPACEPLARHNPHFDRLSLFVCMYKSFVINRLNQDNKLNYKEESSESPTASPNAIGESGTFDGAAAELSFL
jgi:hypothetical protein